MDLVVPARIDEGAAERVRELAAEVFALAGCSGFARCDFFVEPGGKVLVNEINTIPGFTETSVFAKLFEASGIPYPELCDRLAALASSATTRALVRVLSQLEEAHVGDLAPSRSSARRELGDPEQVVPQVLPPGSSGISSVRPPTPRRPARPTRRGPRAAPLLPA